MAEAHESTKSHEADSEADGTEADPQDATTEGLGKRKRESSGQEEQAPASSRGKRSRPLRKRERIREATVAVEVADEDALEAARTVQVAADTTTASHSNTTKSLIEHSASDEDVAVLCTPWQSPATGSAVDNTVAGARAGAQVFAIPQCRIEILKQLQIAQAAATTASTVAPPIAPAREAHPTSPDASPSSSAVEGVFAVPELLDLVLHEVSFIDLFQNCVYVNRTLNGQIVDGGTMLRRTLRLDPELQCIPKVIQDTPAGHRVRGIRTSLGSHAFGRLVVRARLVDIRTVKPWREVEVIFVKAPSAMIVPDWLRYMEKYGMFAASEQAKEYLGFK